MEPLTTLTVLAVATEWMSRHGGVSTVNRAVCTSLAKLGHRVVCLVESPTNEEIESAERDSIKLIAPRTWPGISAHEALGHPLDVGLGFRPDVILGHGPHTGPAAKLQHENWYPEAVRVHFIHVDSGAIEPHKANVDHGRRADSKVLTEIPLAATAGIVVGIGPRLFNVAKDLLLGTSPKPCLLQLDPGLDHITHREELPSRLLVLITGRMEDAPLKGLDIAAEALGELRRSGCLHTAPIMRVRGAPDTDQEALYRALSAYSGNADISIQIRPFSTNPDLRRRDFFEASLVVMPSREEALD